MQLILAIDSDPRRSEQLANLVRSRLQVDLVQATSAGEGLHALKDQVPDLILTSPLLSPFDEGVLDEYLRDLGSAATHVQTLRIPMLSSGPRKKSAAKRLFSLGRKQTPTSSAAPDGCDPKVFADEIAHYLTRLREERSAFAKATADKSFSSQATEGWPASTNAAPEWTPEIVSEPIAEAFEEWTAPQALIEDFRATAPAAAFGRSSAPTAEPRVEQTHVPGSILDLRMPIVRAPEPEVIAEPEPIMHAFVEPEPVAFVEPEPIAYVEPEPIAFVEPEPIAYVEPEPVAYVEQTLPVIETLDTRQVMATPAPANTAPATGNSASFEAALAAIRAAWATPESKAQAPSQPGSPAGSTRPLAGSGEVDLTNKVDALEKVGSEDWSVLDPNQYEFSALVNKLDEVTDSDEVTRPATNRR